MRFFKCAIIVAVSWHTMAALVAEEERSIGIIRKIAGPGKVFVDHKVGKKKRSTEAKIGTALYEKDRIRTEKATTALVIFIDGSSVNIQERSRIRLSRFRISKKMKGKQVFSSLFEMAAGSVRMYMNKNIKGERDARVKTGSTVMGIRGTDVFISNKGGKTAMACVTCSPNKLPTMRVGGRRSQTVGSGAMRVVQGGKLSGNKAIDAKMTASIRSSVSNASHKWVAAKVRQRNRAVKPRIVVETVKAKVSKEGDTQSEKTNATLLEGYSQAKEKARYEADKQLLRKLFKEKRVEIRLAIEK